MDGTTLCGEYNYTLSCLPCEEYEGTLVELFYYQWDIYTYVEIIAYPLSEALNDSPIQATLEVSLINYPDIKVVSTFDV